MVLQWSGMDVTQQDIAAQAFSPGARGTYLADMTGTARRRGQLAVPVGTLPDLLREIAAGHPVIVFQNLGLSWLPRWHYGVVVGYDLTADRIIMHSGQLDRMTMPVSLFLRTWQRGDQWGLVVLPPDRLPAGDDEWEILRAAAALEKTGHPAAAARVYANGAARWPQNWVWPYGLGNARYQLGDLPGARAALRRATSLDPSIPEVRNNLAQVESDCRGRVTGTCPRPPDAGRRKVPPMGRPLIETLSACAQAGRSSRAVWPGYGTSPGRSGRGRFGKIAALAMSPGRCHADRQNG